MIYTVMAGVIALVMVPSFFVPYLAQNWWALGVIAAGTALLCAGSFLYWLPNLTKPWQAFIPGMGTVLVGAGVGFGTVARGITLFLRGRSEAFFDGRQITIWALGAMLLVTYATLWILG